jgi:hypothetical protein
MASIRDLIVFEVTYITGCLCGENPVYYKNTYLFDTFHEVTTHVEETLQFWQSVEVKVRFKDSIFVPAEVGSVRANKALVAEEGWTKNSTVETINQPHREHFKRVVQAVREMPSVEERFSPKP